jgi:hypothetical protein
MAFYKVYLSFISGRCIDPSVRASVVPDMELKVLIRL